MSHHKRKRPRNRRGGCKFCKPWKVNGFRTERKDGEKFSDHRRRVVAEREIAAAPRVTASIPSVWIDETVFERGATESNSTQWVIAYPDKEGQPRTAEM